MAPREQLLATLLLTAFCSSASAQSVPAYTAARQKMVDELIAAEGVTNERVLEAVRTVPRHLFVRPQLRPYAYTDQALDIGHKQTISPPFIVAYMTEVLDPQPEDRVLEIGTGSGYQAAVLSSLVKDVYTIEIVEPLGHRAASLLKSLKYENIHVRVGDGYQGWAEHAPFDKIIVTCSPESVPQPLVEQLKEGGRMIIPLGERYQQVFYQMEKKDGELKPTRLVPALFVPMTGKAEANREVKPDPLHPEVVNGGFEADADENQKADGWHYHRRSVLDETQPYAGQRCLKFENDTADTTSHVLQGFAVDGSQVGALEVRIMHRQSNIRRGSGPGEQPGLVIHFFDGQRKPMSQAAIRPWLADQETWQSTVETLRVPRDAREAIIQLGLNGASGVLWVDEFSMTPK